MESELEAERNETEFEVEGAATEVRMLQLKGAKSEISVKTEVDEVEADIDSFFIFLSFGCELVDSFFSSLYCFLFCYSSASFCFFSSFTFKIASPSAPDKTHSPVNLLPVLPPFTGLGVTGSYCNK